MMPRSLLTVMFALAALAAQAATVEGRLSGPEGTDLSAWRVVAMAAPSSLLPADAAAAPVAADGSFRLEVEGANTVFAVPYHGQTMDLSAFVPRHVDPNEPLELKTLGARAVVRLSLRGPDRAAVTGQPTAYLIGPFGPLDAAGQVVTAESGLEYQNLPAGTYSLWFDTRGTGSNVAAAVASFTVEPGATPLTLPVELPAAGGVSGRLVLADGQVAAGWTIASQSGAEPADPASDLAWAAGATRAYAATATGADGTFSLDGLAAGPTTLDVRRPGEMRAWWSFEVDVPAGASSAVGDLTVPAASWRHLFNGTDLTGWKQAGLWGEVPSFVNSGRLFVPTGEDMSGINWDVAEPPIWDYEVTFQGQRVEGRDFWAGLTFPVGEDPLTLILGGWGGAITGLSSIDGFDASSNQTSTFIQYDNWRWYRVRLAVNHESVRVWVDDEQIIDQPLGEVRLSIRFETEKNRPFGFATWNTAGALRDIRIRPLAGE